jgi:hypothetical protein
MCTACLIARVCSDSLYCARCSKELDEAIKRLIGKPFDDLGFWDLMKEKSSNKA